MESMESEIDLSIADRVTKLLDPVICAVCMDSIYFHDKSQIKLTNCNHIFHSSCISGIVENSDNDDFSNQCPLCSREIDGIDCCIALSKQMKNMNDEIIHFKSYLKRYRIEHDKILQTIFEPYIQDPLFNMRFPELFFKTKILQKQKVKQELLDILYHNKSFTDPNEDMYDF